MTDKARTPFNSWRPAGATPFWLRNGVADHADVERFEAEHRRLLGMDRISIPSPSALCGLIGCKRQGEHQHQVVV